LATDFIPEVKYLAYIESKVYGVDQLNNVVHNVAGDASIADFLNNITSADGAMAMVIDESGNEKTSGDIDKTDMIKVVAADGKTIVYYTFGTLVGATQTESADISIYPNPTSDKLNIKGLEKGSKIQVYNAVGVLVHELNVSGNHETISMKHLPAGMYMVIALDDAIILSKNKIIKK
jgi:hypothetical protein